MNKKLTLVLGLATTVFAPSVMQAKVMSKSSVHHPDSVNRTLQDLVVVADMRRPAAMTRSQVPLSKLPLSITKLNVETLLQQGYTSVPEAIRFVPGASFHTSYGAFYQLQVRGFDYTPIILDGMRDERSTINSYPLADLSDVERIEVLKGPASVLQGHSSEGGLLSITRRRAKAQRNFTLRSELGSWGHFRNTLSFGGALTKHINALGGLSYQSAEGWRKTGDRRLKAYATLSGDWQRDALDLRVSYNRDFYGTEAGLAPVLGQDVYRQDGSLFLRKGQVQERVARDARFNNHSDEMWHRNFNAMLKWTHRFSPNMRLTEHASYNDDLIDYFSTEELSYREQAFKKNALPQQAPYPYYYEGGDSRTYIDLDSVQLTFPLRFAHRAKMLQNQLGLDGHFYTGAIKHSYALGYDLTMMWRTSFTGYKDDDVVGPGKNSLVSVERPLSAGYMTHKFSKANPTQTLDHGFYLQNVLEFNPNLQAMVALRYDIYRYGKSNAVDTPTGLMAYEYPKAEDFTHIYSSALTYRLGLVYTPTEHTNIYASLASIFKPENYFEDKRFTYINSDGQVFTPKHNAQIFKPRQGYQAELGLRSKLSSWLTVDASAFYIKLNNVVKAFNKQEKNAEGKSELKRYRAQLGSVVSKGFETSLTLTPVHGLSLTAGYSLTDARYGKIAKNSFFSEDVATGEPMRYVPKHQIFSHGSYSFGANVADLELHYNYSYTGERRVNATLNFEGYGLLDLGASLRLMKGLRLGVELYNITNTQTYISALNGTQMFPNAPRNFKLHLTYRL